MERPSKPTLPAIRSAAATISRSFNRPAAVRRAGAETVPSSGSRSGVAGGFTDVREEIEERADRDPVADRGVDVVEELVERLLRVPVGALQVRIVAAEHHVLVAHARHRLDRGL